MAATRYCPGCGQDVPVEQSLEGDYLLTACTLCGLGLGLKVASAEEQRRIKGQSTPPPAIMSTSALQQALTPGGPALARVGVVRREMAVAPIVERSAPERQAPAQPSTPPPAITQTQAMIAPLLITPPPAPAPLESVETLAPGDSLESEATGEGGRGMRRVVVVEDSTFLREVTRDLLLEKKLAREVVDLPDGNTFLEDFVRSAAAGQKPDLVVLDVRMPGMDGREAAVAMRAIEAGFGLKRTPILFFSGVLCDEPFKALLAELKNAKYIRKAEGGDVKELGERIVAVLERLVGSRPA